MSDTNPVSLGAAALQKMRSFVGRSAKVSAPITAFCGAIADLASTIAKFSLYLLIFAAVTAVISGFMWFLRYKRQYQKAAADGVLQPEEMAALGERNGWSVTFAFSVVATVVMGGFVVAEKMSGGDEKGVLATVVPGMDKVQEALFRVEKKLDAVKQDTETIKTDTAAVKQDTSKIAASVEEIAKRFDALANTGGVIAEPKTPEEHYHNARIHELGGNFGAARKEYMAYLGADLETLDPWLNYSSMLKVQEGKEGAKETLRYFAEKAKSLSFQSTLVLLEEREPRLAKLEALAKANPDYGPLPYLVSQEFSEAKRGDTTLADQRAEREWLEKFRAAHAAGKFVKFFLDKKEAQKWIETADTRWAKLNSTPAKVLDNPITINLMQSNAGWGMTFVLSDFKTKELFYKLDGKGDFISTGHQLITNPQTGLPMVNMYVPLKDLSPGEHTLEVQYTDKNDQLNGPYTIRFSPEAEKYKQSKMILNLTADSWLAFGAVAEKPALYFTHILTHRPVIQEIRYSLNNESLDQTFAFEPSDVPGVPGNKIYLTIPDDTEFVCVQIGFKDNTKSAMKKFMRKK
jgi:hypothetical protein